jgi:acylphosphatase
MWPDLVARRVLVSGRVQGVWFRESCRRAAVHAGVSGWVRNLDDGRVEVWLEGAADAVERMTAWSGVGSRHSVVTRVSIEERHPAGHHSFEVID